MSCRLLAPAVGVHTYVYVYMGTVKPKSKQGNTTNMNISFSIAGIIKLLLWSQSTGHYLGIIGRLLEEY